MEHLAPEQQRLVVETLQDLEQLFASLSQSQFSQTNSLAAHKPIGSDPIGSGHEQDSPGAGTSKLAAVKHASSWSSTSVFHTTLSELDYLAIAIGLHEKTLPEVAQWSLQFHFDLLLGRPHEYPAQRQQAPFRRAQTTFEQAAQLSDGHCIRLFATSQPLAEQYRSVSALPVEPLTYPINPSFVPSLSSKETAGAPMLASQEPCRITLAGGVRGEKGQRGLDPLIARIAPSILGPKRGTLVVQRRKRSWWRKPQVHVSADHAGPDQSWIQYADHPLSEADYVELIRQAGVGLLLYDGATYYSRRAGVLGEFLAAGVPCIVPAASWLSDQVEQANRIHWQKLVDSLTPIDDGRFSGNRLNLDGLPSDDWQSHLLIIAAHVPQPEPLAARHVAFCAASKEPHQAPEVTGVFSVADSRLWACIPGHELAKVGASIEWQWAFEKQQPLQLLQPKAWLVPPTASGLSQPCGAVGWVVNDSTQVPLALEELLSHRAHYRQSSVAFAGLWRQFHDPRHTVRQVTHVSASALRRVA